MTTRFLIGGKMVELDELVEKAEKLGPVLKARDVAIHRMVVAEDKLEAIKDMISTDLSNHDKLSAIEDILEGEG